MSYDMKNKMTSIGVATGVAFLVLGIVAISMPMMTSLAVSQFIGFLLLFGSIFHLANAFQLQGFWNKAFQIALSGLCLFAGYTLFTNPLQGIASLTTLLAIYFAAKGIIKVSESILYRDVPGWHWLMFEGLASFIVSYLVFANWPASAAWAVGLVVGIDLIMSGVATMNLTFYSNKTMGPTGV